MLLTLVPVSAAVTEKVPTTISMTIDPATPKDGEGFMVTGVLKTKGGEVLGNKYVYLDSTKAGAQHGTLQPLWQVKTSTTGTYSFYRPPQSPDEDLRVRFDGTTFYTNCTSEVVKIKR
jgi:hypothetical protein